MADDFVNNFGLLGQVLFKKRNEREARQRLDEALSRELAKIAAQAGYDKEMVDTRERGAKERVGMSEAATDRRHGESLKEAAAREKRERSDALERLILNNMSARELQGAEATAALNRDEAQYNREKEHKTVLAEIANRKSLADGANAAAQYMDRFGEIDPALVEGLTGVRMGASAGPVAAPTKTGRIKLPSSGGTPPKPGETPRTPNNAAPEVPVQVGPKPLNSGVSIIGGDKAALQGGPDVTPPTLADLMKQAAPARWPYNTLAVDVGQPRAAKYPSLYQQLRGALPEELSGLLPEKGVDALPIIKRDKAGELIEKYLLNQPAIKK